MIPMTEEQIEALAKLFLNIKEMTFIQFIEAVQSGRINIQENMVHRVFVAARTEEFFERRLEAQQ